MLQYSALLLLSVIIFLQSFFPVPHYHSDFPNDPPVYIGNTSVKIEDAYRPHFQKIVLIVIDALRWDFATPELMPLTFGVVEQKGCVSKVFVESPTVTLPRIKALTTGSVPQYIDVVRNLASSEVLRDSWLHSAKDRGLNMVFYGDNTWEKLFPGFFSQSEGTTSFFVWDFSEVDDNVTRNVELELQRTDWDIMILHYLGLDHIGHVLGPFSSKIPTKLTEMDNIIHKIYKGTRDYETLILITGDHGMRDEGGHGGTSHAEVTVPLIAIGHDCLDSSFLQTDIPANLAVLLGLNIPTTSIATIRKEFLNNLNPVQYLYALRYNTLNLLNKNDMCEHTFLNATHWHEQYLLTNTSKYSDLAMELYQNCSEAITKQLYEASNKQDIPSLFLVLTVLVNIVVLLVLNLFGTYVASRLELFGYFSIFILEYFSIIRGLLNIISLGLALVAVIRLRTLLNHLLVMKNYSFINIFLVFTSISHPITFISTSFIEEEHYFWIFSAITLIMLLFIRALNKQNPVFNLSSVKLGLILVFIRFSMDLNSTLENTVQNDDNWANILKAEHNQQFHQIFFVFNLILVFFSNNFGHILSSFILVFVFVLKSISYHNAFLGKLVWGCIFIQKIVFRDFSWQHFWVLSATLLIKPHNLILIPFAVYMANEMVSLKELRHPISLTMMTYVVSNCFYFLQGHRNSLASVDISIGYTGLSDYYPVLVITQVLIHTYTFPVLFHLKTLQHISENKHLFWVTLLTLRASVFLFTGIVTIIFRHHLFVWSVFAPKLFIESVHVGFLFIEIWLWHFYRCVKNLKIKYC